MNFKIPYLLGGFKTAALRQKSLSLVPMQRAYTHFDKQTISTFGNIYFATLL